MDLDFILLYYYIILNIFALLGLFLTKNKTNEIKYNQFYKICPCKKMVEQGYLSTVCIYSSIGGFFYSVLSIGLIGFGNLNINLIFFMTLLNAFLAWKLKT
ncbi:hypothetical protein IRA69_03470 [Campylobacter hepaticus]|nr:hypothetical protein IRA69_03470 [Campylobacter hepaticus]